jgi:hypothetical protein
VSHPAGIQTAARVDIERVAHAGLIALIAVAPFEALRPLLRLPGQSLSTVEATLAAVLFVCFVAVVRDRALPQFSVRELTPWVAFVGAALVAALAAPAFRANAVHMAVRYMTCAIIFALTLVAARSPARVRTLLVGVVAAGGAVALLVVGDFAGVPIVERMLSSFRDGVAVVGAQVRASGPFQYPTIASMYLEIAFAMGLGLLVSLPRGRRAPFVVTLVTLALIAEAVTLTFTRAGLITLALSLGLVGGVQWRRAGFDRATVGVVLLAAILAAELLSSRSAEMLRLRLTSETQGRWFSASIDAPRTISLGTGQLTEVPLIVTNTGRATWDSTTAEPIRLSYHWIADDSDEVVWWEGERTVFTTPVGAGSRVRVSARVRAPQQAGRYRLMWDIEQRYRLWFSTEPDARLVWTGVDVSGPSSPMPNRTGPRRMPHAAARPGRSVLWGAALRMFAAHPLLGVGPDNYRLLYGEYAGLPKADPRVHSNNMYLEVLAGTGLIGLAGALWIGLRVARSCMSALSSSPAGAGIVAACAAVAVHGVVDSFLGFTGTYIAIAVALGIAVAVGQVSTRHAHRI